MKFTYLLPLALGALLALPSCRGDDDDGPSLEDDWVIDEYEYAGNDFAIFEGAEVEFDDGDFEISFTLETDQGNLDVEFEGEYDLDDDELELEYEADPQLPTGLFAFYVTVVSGQLAPDILEEEYEIEFDGADELILTSEIGGNDLEITLERD